MTNEELVTEIITRLGSCENIESAVNCMTRIRIMLRDDASVRDDALKGLDGVLGVVHDQKNYIEIVVGPGKAKKCVDIFRERGIPGSGSGGGSENSEKTSAGGGEKGSSGNLLKHFSRIFAPLIPGITAAGICAGLASLLSQLIPSYAGSPALSVLYNLLAGINTAFMTYLTAWTGYRTAEAFGGTPILGGMVGMFTTLGQVDAISKALGLYDEAQPLNAILRAGRGGVLAAVIGVWLMCKIESAIRRRMPDALDTVLSPLLTLLAALIPYVLIIMPAIGLLSTALCGLVGAVAMSGNPFIRMAAGYLGAALFLPMVAAGMHHGLIALYTVQLETFGYVTLYPALAMAGAGQVGAALAIAVRAKKTGDRRIRHVISGALPAAVLGIGEPLIYGVTLPLGRPFITAGLGGGFGGAFVMLMQVASTTWGPSGILGALVMTEGPNGPVLSVGCYLIGLVISCAAAFMITALTFPRNLLRNTGPDGGSGTNNSDNPQKDPEPAALPEVNTADADIAAPADGELIDIKSVSDPVFAEERIGKSAAFRFTGDKVVLCSPADGTLAALFPTGHAFGVVRDDGVEILVHCGINTVRAQGDGFRILDKQQGDPVKAGDPIVEVDIRKLSQHYDMSTVLIITESGGKTIEFISPQSVTRGQKITR